MAPYAVRSPRILLSVVMTCAIVVIAGTALSNVTRYGVAESSAVIRLSPTPFGGGSGQIVFASDPDDTPSYSDETELMLYDFADETITPLTDNDVPDTFPIWSPDGSHIAFLRSARIGLRDVVVIDANGENEHQLTIESDAFQLAWSPDGTQLAFGMDTETHPEVHVIYADGSNLHQLVQGEHDRGTVAPAWSPDGASILYVAVHNCLYTAEIETGTPHLLTETDPLYGNPSWSPNGESIIFAAEYDGGDPEIYLFDVTAATLMFLTFNDTHDSYPTWSPDGRTIAFNSGSPGRSNIWVMDADGNNKRQLTDDPFSHDSIPAWSPDGTQLTFVSNRNGNRDLFIVDITGENLRQLTDTEANESSPQWRP